MAKFFLGIEILGTSVKIAAIKHDKKFTLVSVDKLNLPLGDAAQDFLSDWILTKFKPEDDVTAVLALSESSIFLEKVKVPATSKKEELEEALYWELSSTTSVPVSELSYDWKLGTDKAGKAVANVALAKSLFVENWVNLFERTGVKVLLVEPSSISFTRIAKADFSKTTLTLVVEEKGTDLVILENMIPIFSTSISVAIGAQDEDRRKLKKDVADEIATSAKKIVSYWEEKEGKKIEQAVITGDIANKYFGLATEINKFLDFPVVVAREKEITDFSHKDLKEKDIEQNMVSIGAALHFLNPQMKSLNLLPKDRKKVLNDAEKLTEFSGYLSLISKINFVVLTATLVVLFSLMAFVKSVNNTILATRKEIAAHPSQRIVSQVGDDNQLVTRVNNYLSVHQNPGLRLNEITNHVPSGITFTKIELDNTKDERWIIGGTGTEEAIIAFFQKLKNDSSAKEVTMPYSNFDNDPENTFEIRLVW